MEVMRLLPQKYVSTYSSSIGVNYGFSSVENKHKSKWTSNINLWPLSRVSITNLSHVDEGTGALWDRLPPFIKRFF